MEEKLIGIVTGILKKDKNIALAYLFGSTVKGIGGPKSRDIDIAVLLKKERRGLDKLKFINKISSNIEAKTRQAVDIVILNQAPVALRQQVVKYGWLLFEKQHGLAHKFIVDTITNYLDYLTILNFFHARAVKRMG